MIYAKAVEKAIDYCINYVVLADFLAKNRAEAMAVSIFEYDEEKHIRNEKNLSYQEGVKQGEARLNQLYRKLLNENLLDELEQSMADENYRKKLFAEYNI